MTSLLAALLALIAPFLIAATAGPPDARALLERVSATYRALRSYHVEGVMRLETEMLGHRQSTDMPLVVAEARPGRGRSETRNPMFGVIRVANGTHSWIYLPTLGEYTHDTTATPLDPGGAGSITAGTPLARYAALENGLIHSAVVRKETMALEGKQVPCWVVSARYKAPGADSSGAPTFFWIDQAKSVVLRESIDVQLGGETGQSLRMSQVIAYSRVRVNQPLPDSLFEFHPPPGAREVARLSAWGEPPASDSAPEPGVAADSGSSAADGRVKMESPSSGSAPAVGAMAPAFELEDLRGKRTRLASFAGKVVLLDFWATWCRPCRVEMPSLARLGRELGKKGLIVVGVNVGEDAAAAAAFMKENKLEFRVLLDAEGEVAKRYGAIGLPTTVVIDRSGRVAAHFVGLQSEDALREAVEKAL